MGSPSVWRLSTPFSPGDITGDITSASSRASAVGVGDCVMGP